MKKLILFVFGLLFISLSNAQTATNFIANDCSGNPHNLFQELDSGKVIILVWVMPCGGCVGAAQTAANIAEDFAATDSGRVFCYVADDYGDASCLTINSWVTNNNIARVTTFSDSAIDMSAYGPDGMPKVVVLGGGTSHTVYFNEDNQFADDSLGILISVDSALAEANGIQNPALSVLLPNLYPNPSTGQLNFNFSATTNETLLISISSVTGEGIRSYSREVNSGDNIVTLDLGSLPAGAYLISIHSARGTETEKVLITERKN